jgi:AcrR family transcriptional regulator
LVKGLLSPGDEPHGDVKNKRQGVAAKHQVVPTKKSAGGAKKRAPRVEVPVDPPVVSTSAPPRGTLNEARFDEILEAAADVFFEKGYKAATTQEIATRAGLLNKGSLYYYIECKEDLLFALADRAHADSWRDQEEDTTLARSDARTRLNTFIERRLASLSKADRRQFLIEEELRSLSPQRLASVMAQRRKFHDLLGEILRQGMAEGRFDPAMDVSVVVNSLLLLVNTTHRWYRPTGRVGTHDMIEWYQTFILRGLGDTP